MTKTCLNFFASISIDSTIPVVNLLGSFRLLPRYQLPHLPAMATASDSGTSTATWSATWSDMQTSSSDFFEREFDRDLEREHDLERLRALGEA